MTDDPLRSRLRDALAGSHLEVDEVLDGARAEARARVHAVLVEQLTDELLRRCLDRLAAPETPPSPHPTSAPQAPPDTATYLFGVVPLGTTPPDGVPALPGGGDPRLVTARRCAAIVCDMDPHVFRALEDAGDEALDLLTTAAMAHDQVLAALARRGPVLPLRLGTVLPDDEAVLALLKEHDEGLVAELDRLHGHAEWALTVRNLELQEDDDPLRSAGSGRDYLTRRRDALRQRDQRWELEGDLADTIHRDLATYAVEAQRVESRPYEQAAPPLLHGVYLVRDEDVSAFERVVSRLRDDHPATAIELSGPWPAYHFTRVRLDDDVGSNPR